MTKINSDNYLMSKICNELKLISLFQSDRAHFFSRKKCIYLTITVVVVIFFFIFPLTYLLLYKSIGIGVKKRSFTLRLVEYEKVVYE